MPEQSSNRGQPVTKAQFEGSFDTIPLPFGPARLNLQDDIDALEPGYFPRLTNLVNDQDGRLTARPGQTSLATSGTEHHSVRRFVDPQAADQTRIWGIDADLYRGLSGGLVQIDTGYSGQPLALVPHRPPLSGDPWMFVGDKQRMRKVRFDGLDLPIGLPAPAAAATIALAAERRTLIADTDPGGLQAFGNWTSNAGFLYDANGDVTTTPTAVPFTSGANSPSGSIGVNFQISQPTNPFGFFCFWGCPLVNNLSLVGGVAADDADYVHAWMNFSATEWIEEVRIYLVCSALFDPTVMPGIDRVANTDSYVKAFSANDFFRFVQAMQAQKVASETARIRALRDDSLKSRSLLADIRQTWADRRAERDFARTVTFDLTAGNEQWGEFGVVGVPLRRGDWQRLGQTAGRSWDTITGIITFMKIRPNGNDYAFRLADLFMTGGSGPDTGEPGAQLYDYRVTDYDPRTGAESNPSPEMAAANHLDSLRRGINVTPAAPYGDAAVRQRVYRRGGSLVADWYFVGQNASDGGVFLDALTDDSIVAAGTVQLDHFQPIPTVNDAGTTVLNQAIRALWGPLEGMLFGCGDPHRPGHLYFCLQDQPDHWSASGNVEVCAPSEELMNGDVFGSQAFVFSRRSLYLIYPGLTSSGSVNYTPTLCKRGLWHYWTFAAGPTGVYFMAEDGIFLTSGGPEEWISREIDPLFRGETRHGYLPIDKDAKSAIRMTIWEHKLFFQYQDTDGDRQCMVYHILEKAWRHYEFGRAHSVVQGEDEAVLLIGGLNQGATYLHEGFSDAGLAIAATMRSRSDSGGRREDKLLGDQFVDADRQGVDLTLQNFLNEEAVTNLPQLIDEGTGRQRYILDSFGVVPQRAHSLATEIRWSSGAARPVLYQMGTAITLNPEVTSDRVTNWDDLGSADESWVTGITFDVDTFNQARTIIIERDFAGVISTIDTLTVQTDGRHKVKFSWAALPAHQVRVRPSDECKFWVLYRADWIALPEPPRISKWDIHFENAWDQYYTGLDLYCDTLGAEKRLEVYVDETLLTNPFTGNPWFPIVANGRRVVHLTFLAGRGHVFRFKAIDDNPGLLYTHRWHLQEEPSEQANWNQNFAILGSRADKYLKAVVFECDTFGATKNVRVEADGAVVETLTVNTNGRKVVQIALTQQALGRVWRMYPADGNPGRLYSAQPVFDEEPFCLDRWESQETNHGLPGWFYLTTGHVTVKSSRPVTLTVTMHINQLGGTITRAYEIPSTGGLKQRNFVSFDALKGVLVKYVLTSEDPFWLYQEETNLFVAPWGGEPTIVRPFGNADMDPTRGMVNSVLAAGRSGGGTS